MNKNTPVVPAPKAVTLDANKTALIVLDQSQQAVNPNYHGHSLIPGLTRLLDKARRANTYIIFTNLKMLEGTPNEQIYSGYNRKVTEPVVFTDLYDKFIDTELRELLKKRPVDTLILVGSRANLCVLYTGTRAASDFKYKVVIPVDGMAGPTRYEEEFTLHQFSTFPAGVSDFFTFTTIDGINFL